MCHYSISRDGVIDGVLNGLPRLMVLIDILNGPSSEEKVFFQFFFSQIEECLFPD